MEPMMETVGKHCQGPLSTFQRCILASKGNQAECVKEQQALADCAAQAVPLLQTMKQQCGHLIRDYDECLLVNRHASDEELTGKCLGKLQALADCTNEVKTHAEQAGGATST
ncbi:Similar to S.cerevisiae protein MIX14 (Mitochondrial intermembrane space protein of unknown function) [Malassezia sympodialis ATCC 42132]|uniref:IMS import disulfide relay-system CHCH-CHCH-like Cx9C domain-containing protein n=1 Tax=Malassezia sympodialis (strain ATCC 42132) TaxID=1230383 RepID=A0A1M8A8C2_MALS4|nr:Similar to S.cerevisiae protein MIX14 (Mitochondrial intermembrane space protein of unknown function) [Malassezia sympodialis ATCC 42132]